MRTPCHCTGGLGHQHPRSQGLSCLKAEQRGGDEKRRRGVKARGGAWCTGVVAHPGRWCRSGGDGGGCSAGGSGHAPSLLHKRRIKVLLLLYIIYQYAYSCHAHAGIPHRTPALASLRLPSYPHSQQPPSGSLGRKTKPTPSPPLPRPRCTASISLVFAQKPLGWGRSPHDKIHSPMGESKNEWVDQ